MEQDAVDNNKASLLKTLNDSDERPRSAVNSVILDYYKKFGRKRDLEQYFSLSTAQNEIRDPSSLFWRRMKEQSDTSDSGERKSESSNEICRISIRCSIPETSEAEKRDSPSNNESESPPIITDAPPEPLPSGDESFGDNHSLKSADATLDTSINKPLSPTSSITSQRKLEWDSLADVGYGNESERKTSASSLSTLEREVLAQKQQYTLDCKQNSDLGIPTAHSTPVDPNDSKLKGKKGLGKKTISISRKDVDLVEVNVPHGMENVQPINVNLTKQFSVNLQKDGGMTIDNVRKDITVSPEKKVGDSVIIPAVKFDKEIQTSLLRLKEKDQSPVDSLEKASTSAQKNLILIGFNTLKRRQRRKKIRKSRTKLKSRKKIMVRKDITADKDKSGEQVSEAESFEYMPGHMYNQNQLKRQDQNRSNNNIVGNKSSLESSAVHTTDSSKESKYSFNKDLDKTLNVLKSALKEKYDCDLKKKLVKEVIQRLLKSNYGEGETTPDFLSVLNLTSKKTPTTSTSEADNIEEKVAHSKPKKSILRVNKFDPMNVASTSQSAPNLPSVVNSDKPVMSYLSKLTSSTTTETDLSNNSAKDITSSDTAFAKTSSQELYKKYINALKREEAYKQHLREKEMFLKQKLVRSEPVKKVPLHYDLSKNTNLKELIKDLTRNNYDDGSGDASKLEGGSSSNFDTRNQGVPRKHRSHSVFTLSSGNSENRNCNLKPRSQKKNTNSPRAGASNWDRNMTGPCNRPVTVTDSSVQVNINQDKQWSCNPSNIAEEKKYVCLCSEKTPICPYIPAEMKEVQKYPNPKPKAICVASQPVCPMHAASVNPNSEGPLGECTRCLQTKISIHPKISDPSVSDLNIVHSAECVQLIHELYKKVSQTNSVCQCSNEKDDCNSYTCKSSKDNMPSNDDRDEQDNLIDDVNAMTPLTDKNIIQSCLGCNKTFANQPEGVSDNIVIPIQGTNMMLKLSIGGGGGTMNVQDKQVAKDNQMVCRANTLDRENNDNKLKTILKGPSVNKCSISVQAERSPSVVNTSSTTCGLKTNQKQDFSPRETLFRGHDNNTERETHAIKSNHHHLDSVNVLGRNTYPKKVQISDKKPLIRSNTDTSNLGASSGIQTKTIYSKDKDTISCFRAEMDQTLSKKQSSKSLSDRGTQPRTNKETSSDRTVSESPKSSADEKFQSYKNKYSSQSQRSKEKKGYGAITDEGNPNDLVLDVIKDITKRYSKEDTDKHSKKKCYKEIMTALTYLLDTDDSGDGDQEFSKESQKPKEVQRPKEQNSELELISEDFLNEAERTKFASRQKSTNVVPRKNIKEASESKTKTESSSRKSGKSDEGSGSLRSGCQTSSALKNESSHERCLCGCGFSDCKECMTPRSTEYETGKESCKISEKNKTSVEESSKIKTCDMGCGCDGSSECKDCGEQPSSKYRTDTFSKESTKSNKQESRCHPPKETRASCDKGCGCDGSSDCNECGEPPSPKQETCTSAITKNLESRCTSPKETKSTYDKGCGCDESSECNECGEPPSLTQRTCTSAKTKNQETRCTSPKTTKTTCDRGCGCDGSSECKECVEPHSPKRATYRSGKESPRACSPIKKKITTCDKGCGCDGSECGDCVETQPPKYRTGKCGKESVHPKKQSRCSSPMKTKTSDRGCGCDDLSECSECVGQDSSKCGTDTCGKDAKKSKKENRCYSPKKRKCDKCCGCGGSSECSECVEHHSSKHGTGKCGKDSMRKERCNSPRKPRTCDRACGCDGSSECSECVEPHSPRYGVRKCGKEPVRTKYASRCSSPNKVKRTCDKTCGCYGASECKDCSHKTGKCGRETSCRKQEAKKFVNKCVQSTVKRVKSLYSHCDDSSDLPVSTDPPCCSTDSPTAKFVNKIKKECEKYQKRKVCKCEASSSTAVSCDHCRRAEKHCRHRKCRCHRSRSTEKVKKKCVAYNLILQTSDSLISEEAVIDQCRKLQNVIIRVPKCKQANVPFREACAKIEQKLPYCDTRFEPKGRSQSWPNDCGVSSTDDVKMAKACTVRDYLEINRPDFVDRCATRQNCIRMTSESRAKERSELREQLVGLGSLPSLNNEELIYLAKQLGFRRNRPLRQKIMSEREMKKHSEKIYKTLPEVAQKKEDAKKDSVKKTNLLMANIFKKNLQKKALSGDVNISNYSQVVKI